MPLQKGVSVLSASKMSGHCWIALARYSTIGVGIGGGVNGGNNDDNNEDKNDDDNNNK